MWYSDFEDPQFQKVFEFERTHEWRLPKTVYSGPHFEIQELQDMKRELNQVKGKLSEFDLAEWSLHTQNRDVAGYVHNHLKRRIKPELLTQAWCKFYEVISTFPIVQPNEDNSLRSLHLCEAPGAFMCALNHYLVLHYPDIYWEWHANTLNPDYEGNPSTRMISDDRLICHTRNNWLFGFDLTGDILEYYNHVDIVEKISSVVKINLVTADGSINCMNDPGEQERTVEFLHYCETITALAVLNTGGAYVLKIFTIFEESTVCLLYLLNCVFNKSFLFKPCTSKSGNSELYLVCIGFNGLDTLNFIWERLVTPYKNGFFDNNVSMFSIDDIPNSFKLQIKSCCSDFFLEKQIGIINDNIYYFLNPDKSEKDYVHHRKIEIANRYIKKYKLKAIPKECRLVPYIDVHFRIRDLEISNIMQSICLNEWNLSKFVDISLGKRYSNVFTSKFASVECIEDLIKYLDKNQSQSPLYNLVLQALDQTSTVINVKSFKLMLYFEFQKDLFTSIDIALSKEKHIVFINVPFHTHFLAALWLILASAFENVYYAPGWCLFHKPLAAKVKSAKNIFAKIENAYNNIGNCIFPSNIINIFPPNVFCEDFDFVLPVLKVCNSFQIPR